MGSRTDRKEPTARARRAWQRLQEFYGARLAENYGPEVPPSWAEMFDRANDADIRRALVTVRSKYMHHPPTLPEVEDILRPRVASDRGKSIPQLLADEVVRRYWPALSEWQRVQRWNYVSERYQGVSPAGDPRTEHTIVAVVVPQDPADPTRYPSVRVEAAEVVRAVA